jgi:hypothetical protein
LEELRQRLLLRLECRRIRGFTTPEFLQMPVVSERAIERERTVGGVRLGGVVEVAGSRGCATVV